jgi:hypothetical protein
VQLTDGDFEDQMPAWSPDGSTVVFVSARDAQCRPLLGRRTLEAVAYLVALAAQLLDLALGRPHFGIQAQQLIEIEMDILVRDRPGDDVPIVPDEIHAEHRCAFIQSRTLCLGSAPGPSQNDSAA